MDTIGHQHIGMYHTPALTCVFIEPHQEESIVHLSIEASLTVITTWMTYTDVLMPWVHGCTGLVVVVRNIGE